jgi:AraC-like DNA-binding protein
MKQLHFVILFLLLLAILHGLRAGENLHTIANVNDREGNLLPYIDDLSPKELLDLATEYSNDANIKGAIYTNKEFLNRTADDPYFEPRGEVFLNLAWSYYQLGEFDKSLQHLFTALDFYQFHNDSLKLARVYNNMANIYSQYGDYEEALEYYFACLEIFEAAEDDHGLSIIYANIGYIKGQLKEYEEGLFYLKKSLDVSERAGIKDIIGQLHIIGFNYREQNKPLQAAEYYTRALETAKEIGNAWNIIRSLNNLGSLYIELRRFERSESYLAEAQKYLEEYDFRELEKDNLFIRSLLYEEMNQPLRALELYKQYEAIKDEMYSKEKLKVISELKTVHEIERKEQEIKLLQAENEVINKEIQARKTRYRIVLTGGVLVTLLLTMLYFQSRQKMSAYRQLVLKNLEIIEREKKQKEVSRLPDLSNQAKTIPAKFDDELKNADTDDSAGVRYVTSSLSDEQKNILLQKVRYQFDVEKIFQDPELSLDKLATLLDTNNKYLSQIINESFNKSFISYVHDYRIKEAMKLLADKAYSQYTIETVAEMVGFNSKSAFNRSFKRITGLTPSFFQKTSLESQPIPELFN